MIMILALDHVYPKSFASFCYFHTNIEKHLNQRSQTVVFKTKFCVCLVLYSSFSLDVPFPLNQTSALHIFELSVVAHILV